MAAEDPTRPPHKLPTNCVFMRWTTDTTPPSSVHVASDSRTQGGFLNVIDKPVLLLPHRTLGKEGDMRYFGGQHYGGKRALVTFFSSTISSWSMSSSSVLFMFSTCLPLHFRLYWTSACLQCGRNNIQPNHGSECDVVLRYGLCTLKSDRQPRPPACPPNRHPLPELGRQCYPERLQHLPATFSPHGYDAVTHHLVLLCLRNISSSITLRSMYSVIHTKHEHVRTAPPASRPPPLICSQKPVHRHGGREGGREGGGAVESLLLGLKSILLTLIGKNTRL